MSVTKTHEPSEEDGWSPFNDYVEQRPGVCNNCYTVIRRTVKKYDPMKLRKSLRGVLSDEVEETENAGRDFRGMFGGNAVHDYPTIRSTGSATYCKSCGSDTRLQLADPLPEGIIVELGENIHERIDDIDGLYLNKSAFLNDVIRAKQDPSIHQSSRRIFQQSVDSLVKVNHDELPGHDSE